MLANWPLTHPRRRQRITHPRALTDTEIHDRTAPKAKLMVVVLLRKLDDYHGDSQFWTSAWRFAALEASRSIRRCRGHDRVGISRDPERALTVAGPPPSRSGDG